MSSAPENAAGTEPMHSHSTSWRFTVRRRRCTIAPAGFMKRLATTSEETAVSGSTRKTKISMGVMRAPPPMPVRPTTKPTTSPPRISGRSRLKAHHSDRKC